MRLRKMIIGMIVGAAVVLQCISGFTVYAVDGTAEKAEVTEVSAERAELLRSLGTLYDLADDETEDLTQTVSREEYAKILVKYFNRPYTCTELTQKPYIDVELTNEYARDIKTIKDYGYVPEISSQKFRPHDAVTLNEAAEMLVLGLGYTYIPQSELKNTASGLDIFKGISKNRDEGAILDDIYAMLYNTLSAGMAEKEYKNGRFSYNSSDEKTVLSEYYDSKKMRGKVTANSKTGISEASKAVGENQIEIDGKAYGLKYRNCSDYLGYTVEFYLNSEDEEVVYAVPYKNNTVTEIDADDLIDADNTQISYSTDGSNKKLLKAEQNFDVIYNKKAYSGYGSIKDILPEEGSVTVIDNDGNGRFDVLLITSYDYYMVNDVYSQDKKVYTTDAAIVLDLNDDKADVEIRSANGNLANFAAIKKNSVLTVAKSKNTDGDLYIAVIISDEKVTGAVKGKNTDKVTIEKKEYPATKDFLNNISVGDMGTFYLTHNGKAAFYKAEGENSWNVGMVYKKYRDEVNDNRLCLIIYTPQNEFIQYSAAKKVKISKTTQLANGASGWNSVYSALDGGDVIRYSLNGEGMISKIEKADEGSVNAGERTYTNEQGLRVLGEASASFYYRNGIFDGKVVTDKDTLFFVTPKQDNWGDKDLFYTSASSILQSNVYEYSYPYKAYAYGNGDVSYANVVVVSDAEVSTSNINTEATLYVIDSISSVVRDGDEIYNQLILYGNGEKSVYYCTDEVLNQYVLQKHDIIQFEADSEKRIRAVKKIVNADSGSSASAVLIPGTKNSNGTNPSKDVLYSGLICYGTVRKKSDKYIEYTYADDTRYIGLMARCKYTKITDESKHSVSTAVFDDVSAGDNFVAVISSGEVRDMIIIK